MHEFLLKDAASKKQVHNWLRRGMAKYSSASCLKWNDEDSLCEQFFLSISGNISTPVGLIDIRSYKVRGRGRGAPEKKLGADGLGLVKIITDTTHLSGYFLFQAKKAQSQTDRLRGAKVECEKMLMHSAASYLLILMPSSVKMIGAMAVGAYKGKDPALSEIPFVGFPGFICQQILQGLMLEPFDNAKASLTPELRKELKHIVTVIGTTEQRIQEALSTVNQELQSLEFGEDIDEIG